MSNDSRLKSTLMLIAVISYFGLGFVQLFAIYSFFNEAWDWWMIPSFIAAIFVTYIPLLGAAAGTYAAHEIWGWTWYWSALLFFWPVVLAVFAGLLATLPNPNSKHHS